jgi:hypothetical protein
MKHLRTICQAMTWAALGAWCWFLSEGVALAVPPVQPKDSSETTGAFALPYAFVILAFALGILVVVRSANRREREKPEEYQSKDLLSK